MRFSPNLIALLANYVTVVSIFNHCNVIGQQSNGIRWKNAIRAIMPFKVIKVGISSKPVC